MHAILLAIALAQPAAAPKAERVGGSWPTLPASASGPTLAASATSR